MIPNPYLEVKLKLLKVRTSTIMCLVVSFLMRLLMYHNFKCARKHRSFVTDCIANGVNLMFVTFIKTRQGYKVLM